MDVEIDMVVGIENNVGWEVAMVERGVKRC